MAVAMMAWMVIARQLLGTREVPGSANSATIMAWAKFVGVKDMGAAYTGDAVPWCGLFVAYCLKKAGLPVAEISLRARSWADWGANLREEALAYGAVLVFQREGGGHVGFYVGEGTVRIGGKLVPAYRVLGGNQSDNVTETWIAKDRCIARRWPRGVAISPKRIYLDASGATLSQNEA